MKQRVKYICDECDTDSLEFPATVIWDSTTQVFALSGPIEIANSYCASCSAGDFGFHVELVDEVVDV